jgi:hypothetical protein
LPKDSTTTNTFLIKIRLAITNQQQQQQQQQQTTHQMTNCQRHSSQHTSTTSKVGAIRSGQAIGTSTETFTLLPTSRLPVLIPTIDLSIPQRGAEPHRELPPQQMLGSWESTAKNEGRISSSKGPQKRPSAKTTEELAAEFRTLTLSEEEENLLQHLRAQWQAYHRDPVIRQGSTTQYQELQHRMLCLLVLPEWELVEEFDCRRDQFDWAAPTAAQYWSAMRSAASKVGIRLPLTFAHRGKVLAYLAKEEDEKRPTQAAIAAHITAARVALPLPLAIALQLAFDLGQRIGDTLHVEAGRVFQTDDPATNTKFVTVMYRRGKTVRRRDPFCLHIPPSNHLASELLHIATSTPSSQKWLFAPPDGRAAALRSILTALKGVDQALGLLSIRRGGLQALAQAGATQETLLHHSRHTTAALLNRYLGWGRLNLHAAREIATLQTATTASTTDATTEAGKNTL